MSIASFSSGGAASVMLLAYCLPSPLLVYLLLFLHECIPWNCYCLLKAALGVFPHSHFYSMTGVIDVLQTSKRARVMKH